MATITKSIGTASRDYSTITSWEADLDNSGVYASGDAAVGECYNDSAFDESVTINGGGTVGLASRRLSVASGQRHTGIAGTGSRITRTAATITITISIATTLEWLEINENGYGPTEAITHNVASAISQRLIIHDLSRSGNSPSGIVVLFATGQNICNTIIYDIKNTANPSGGAAYGIDDQSGSALTVCNVTIHDIGATNASGKVACANLDDETGGVSRNIICTSPTNGGAGGTACFVPATFSSGTASNNLSSDATASGSGSLTNKTAANQFVSTTGGSEDLHLKAGADAIDTGTDLGTTPTGVNFDIDNRDRDAQGDTWDIGADEYVAAASTAVPRRQSTYGSVRFDTPQLNGVMFE